MKKANSPINAEASPSHGNSITSTAPTKIACVLEYMVFTGSLNTFEGEREVGDHSLPSTISDLANGYGLSITRTDEKVPTRWGRPTIVTRYSIPDSEHMKAKVVLAILCKRSKQSPVVTHE
ncbi:Helix-turn-helix domain-containing protein [Pseudomonas pohangensis]|uniref:Helix-turn-helix domain-containing protein n=1 Tax=Pseudomonas pohangensis TaxID=364197 RepID=A0A1H2ET00_9PSED|nr:hypothetical protein [Pseudomonas pohangensis]SDT97848.1 Helix-turn-helix domain-containing protein [Pseudomonas pohangensis]